MPNNPKQIVYRYNDDLVSEEGFVDWCGDLPLRAVDEIVERHGKRWKVIAIDDESTVAGTNAIPIHRVYLIAVL
jgi:hypothetical protein